MKFFKETHNKITHKFIVVFAVLVSPILVFPWGESMHPISEILIHHIVLTEDYVFCGSDASWGTNEFGLFVFDRKGNTWKNHSKGNEFPLKTKEKSRESCKSCPKLGFGI